MQIWKWLTCYNYAFAGFRFFFFCLLSKLFILFLSNQLQFIQYFLISGIRYWGNRCWHSRYVHWWSHCGTDPSTTRCCTSASLGKWRDRLQRQRQIWQYPKTDWGVYWGVKGPNRYTNVLGVLNTIMIIGWAAFFQQKCPLDFKEPVNKIIVNLMRQVKRYKQAQREFMHIQVMIFLIQLREWGRRGERRGHKYNKYIN